MQQHPTDFRLLNNVEKESTKYRAKITDDSGVIRGKVLSPLVPELDGRPGDYLVFNSDGSGSVNVRLARGKTAAKKSTRKR